MDILHNSILKYIKDSFSKINPKTNFNSLNKNISGDILAGITVGIIALPLALAFGQVSQLGPISGILGAISGGIIGGLFGGCALSVSGPTAPTSSQIASFLSVFIIGTINQPDFVAVFSIIFLSGIIIVGISLLRISHYIHFIPYSVVAGFMCGIGLMVILGQINSFVGLESKKNVYQVLQELNNTLKNINKDALLIGIVSLFFMFLWPKLKQKYKLLFNIPAPLIALLIGTSISYFLNLNIPYIGDQFSTSIQSETFKIYFPNLSRLNEFIAPAFTVAGLIIIDSLLTCIISDNLTGTRHISDREIFGQGIANMVSGLIGGVSTATATMFTVSNIKFGGKTPLSSIVYGLTLVGILLGLKSFVEAIPIACIAAILIKVGLDILDYRVLPILRKLPKIDLFIFTIVLFITITYNLMVAVSIGVFIAVLFYFKDLKYIFNSKYHHNMISFSESNFIFDSQQDKFTKLPIVVLKLQKALFFGSIEKLLNVYRTAQNHKILIVDMGQTSKIDLSGAYALEDIIKSAKIKGISVIVYNPNNKINKIFQKLNFVDILGKNNYFDKPELVFSYLKKQFNIN